MWALLLGIGIQAAVVPNGIGWSVYSPTPLLSHDVTAARCVGRHRGSRALDVQMRCRIGAGGWMADCEAADGRSLSRRDFDTLQCVARSQRSPAGTADDTMLLTVTIVTR